MTPKNQNAERIDSFEAMRSMRDKYLESLSRIMIDAVNSEEYAAATGAMLNGALAITAPFREALDKAVAAGLQQYSMPSRQEIAVLAERFTNIEMRLDDMDAKLDRIAGLVALPKAVNGPPNRGAAAPKSPPQGSRRKA